MIIVVLVLLITDAVGEDTIIAPNLKSNKSWIHAPFIEVVPDTNGDRTSGRCNSRGSRQGVRDFDPAQSGGH